MHGPGGHHGGFSGSGFCGHHIPPMPEFEMATGKGHQSNSSGGCSGCLFPVICVIALIIEIVVNFT